MESSSSPLLNRVVVGMIARIVPDGAQAIATAALGFRTVDSFHCHFHKQRNRGERTDGNQSDGGRLPKRPPDFIGDEHSNPQAERGAREREQTIEGNLLAGFWNGYRKRHRIPLYVSFWKRKRENLAARAAHAPAAFFAPNESCPTLYMRSFSPAEAANASGR